MKLFVSFLLIATALLTPALRYIKPYLEERLPDTFDLTRIAFDMQGQPSFGAYDLSGVEDQVFRYIGHGEQAVAFASDDGLYVLKFFLTRSLHGDKKFPIPKPTHWIPSHRKARREKREQTRMNSLRAAMHNYVVAYEKIKDKTGLLYLHLQAGDDNLPTVTVLDRYGNKHRIDLNRASFVFQKRAMLVKEKLQTASTKEEKGKVIALLHQFFAERARAGFIDIARSFMIEANYGFLGDLPIQLDVGNIEYLEELKNAPDGEICRMRGLLNSWAKTYE